MAVDKKIKYEDKKPAMQGGGPNYLGKQKEVKVPVRWKSSPDHPDTELAYITEPEKQVLIALNMHGGLEDGKPNKGPKGVISLQGDLGGYDASPGGPNDPGSGGAGPGGRVGQIDKGKQRAADIMTGKANVTSPTGITEGYTGDRGVQRGGIGDFVGQRYTGGGLFSGANRFGYRDVYTSGPRMGETKPGYLGTVLGGLASLVTGVPVIGGVIGKGIDYGKGIFSNIFSKDYYDSLDEEEKERIANLQIIDGKLVDTRNFEDTFGMSDQVVSAPSISNLSAFDRFNIEYNPNQSVVDIAAVQAAIENARNQGSS